MKLFLMAFGFLITAAVSAQEIEPKGSFELKKHTDLSSIAMVDVEEGKDCDHNGDIGMSEKGLILSCQSDGERRAWGELGLASLTTTIRAGNPCSCLSGEIRTGCTGKQSGAYDTYAGASGLCYGERGNAQCICTKYK